MNAAHPVLTHRNGEQCILLDGGWFPLDAGGEGGRCENSEHGTHGELAEIPHGHPYWEYGVMRPAFPHLGIPEHIEWGASVGMTHRYEYTAENVHGFGEAYRRRRVLFPQASGPPEPFPRGTKP